MRTLMQHGLLACCAATALCAAQARAQNDKSAQNKNSREVPATSAKSASAGPVKLLSYEGEYPTADAGDTRIAGTPYAISRWAEDWRGIGNRPGHEPIDRLKDIVIAPDILGDGSISLRFTGQNRIRYNFTGSPGLREGKDQNQILARTVIGADLHLGDHLRFYGELANGLLEGSNYGAVSGRFRNRLTVLQSFVDAWAPIPGNGVVGVRYGRQEFADGPPALVSVREALNIHLTFNGVRAWANWKRVRIDAFSFKTTTAGTGGIGDDIINDGERFKGVNMGLVLADQPGKDASHLYLDPFYYDYHNDAQIVGGRSSADHRISYGARFWGNWHGFDVDWTAVRQTGSVRNALRQSDVDAWAVFLDQSYTLPLPLSPEIGFHYNRGSGGGAYGSGKVRDFNYMFGNAPLFSNALFFSPANLEEYGPSFGFKPAKKIALGGSYELLSRVHQGDAIYVAAGPAYAGTQNAAGHDVGTLARLNFSWILSPHAQVLVFAEHLEAGRVLKGAGFDNADYFGSMIKFRF